MNVISSITIDDVLRYIGIKTSSELFEEIDRCATNSKSVDQFLNMFEEYYSEHGLGGDDTWLDVKTYLPLFLTYDTDNLEDLIDESEIEEIKLEPFDKDEYLKMLKDSYNRDIEKIRKENEESEL